MRVAYHELLKEKGAVWSTTAASRSGAYELSGGVKRRCSGRLEVVRVIGLGLE